MGNPLGGSSEWSVELKWLHVTYVYEPNSEMARLYSASSTERGGWCDPDAVGSKAKKEQIRHDPGAWEHNR